MNLCLTVYWSIVIFILGLSFGSFLNVCIYRIPKNKSVSWPPSACPKCTIRIKWYDNLPILSWFLLRGKCRHCNLPISIVYPIVELLTALLLLLLWLIYGLTWFTIIYQLAALGLLLVTVIDIKHMILPDRITIGGIILFPLISTLFPPLHGVETWQSGLIASLSGLAIGFGTLWIIRELGTAVLKKEAMGFGDVKFMGAIGALLGWQAVLYTLFFSALIGSVVGTSLIISHRNGIKTQIPYGPHLAFAALSWILGGDRLWDAYLTLLGC